MPNSSAWLQPWTQPWMGWALLAALFAAATTILSKVGIRDVDSDVALFVRTSFVIVLLAGFLLLVGKWENPLLLPRKAWLFLGLAGAATAASWLCFFRALQLGDAARVAPIDKLSVAFVAVLAVAFLGERPTVREWFGIAMIAGGAFLVAQRR